MLGAADAVQAAAISSAAAHGYPAPVAAPVISAPVTPPVAEERPRKSAWTIDGEPQ